MLIKNFRFIKVNVIISLKLNRNLFADEYFSYIRKNQFIQIEILKIHGNKFSSKSNSGFLDLLNYNKQLFIYNYWEYIDDQLALGILKSYKIVFFKY